MSLNSDSCRPTDIQSSRADNAWFMMCENMVLTFQEHFTLCYILCGLLNVWLEY